MRTATDRITKGVRFQRGVYAFCRAFAGPVVNVLYNIRYKPCKIRSKTFLALGNHTRNLDPALLVIGTRRHMRFVANAVLTHGVAGFFLNPLFGLIPREKGAKGDAAFALIEANLKAGISVGMFPEGNRCWDGVTEYIPPRTAQILKDTGVGLLTYRLTGGYLLKPRWAEKGRHGPMRGELVHEYTPEELSGMTVDEIYDVIRRHLHVDAFAEQEATGFRYKGKALAEGMERAAYLCPHCHRFATVRTEGDRISCDCGLSARYLDTGHFGEKELLRFDNLAQWNSFQKQWINEHGEELRAVTGKPIAEDAGMRISIIEDGVCRNLTDDGKVSVFGDRIELNCDGYHRSFPIGGITGFGTSLKSSMYFNCGPGLRVKITASKPVSTLKYYALWRGLSGREYL